MNNVAYALIGAHRFADALPFARKAVAKTGRGTLLHAYATFNLGYVLLKLGRCAESLPPLNRALALEPKPMHRYIRPRIKQAEQCVQRAAAAPAQSR